MREPKVPINTPQPTTQAISDSAHPGAGQPGAGNPAVTPTHQQGTSLPLERQQRLDSLLLQTASLAEELTGEPEQLLDLLRQLEILHRRLQEGAFRSSLPADRNQLFALLRRMERSGGWPYIPRLQLRTFIDLLQVDADEAEAEAAEPAATGAPTHGDADQVLAA